MGVALSHRRAKLCAHRGSLFPPGPPAFYFQRKGPTEEDANRDRTGEQAETGERQVERDRLDERLDPCTGRSVPASNPAGGYIRLEIEISRKTEKMEFRMGHDR